jgi:transposase
MREVVNGVMYVLSTGCQWRYIPKDLPPRSTERWLAKFGQVDKWSLCLRAARMPQIRSDHDETSTPDTCTGF